jgi:hypothetical protein
MLLNPTAGKPRRSHEQTMAFLPPNYGQGNSLRRNMRLAVLAKPQRLHARLASVVLQLSRARS